ncbi:MAG TPA: ABC transporter permease [Castellaniella sp.]|nr:ABC transporter permease [Castellaniella sp.]
MAQDSIRIALPPPVLPVRGVPPIGAIWRQIIRFARTKPLGAFGGVVALVLVVVAIFAPVIATHDPNATNSALVFAPPGSEYWLGGDQVGRDVFSRLVYGARISLYAGLLSAFIGASIGMLIGVTSAHFGGMTDLIIQRVIDALMAFPPLILAIAIMAALGASLNNVVIALSIAFIPSTARVLRSQALAVNEMNYILAAKAIGAGHARIIFRYMIPNCLALYIVLLTVFLGTAIVAEATLSFLGIGVPPDVPSWGGMLNGAAQTYVHVAPWLGIFPGLAIALVVFAWNLLGDALRDVLDPRLRGTA